MNAIVLSRHAEMRIGQRGMRPCDLELIYRYGTAISNDIWFLKERDVRRETRRLNREIRQLRQAQGSPASLDLEREIRRRKREIQALERLRGRKLVVANDTAVTCYRSGRRDRKRILRRGREKI